MVGRRKAVNKRKANWLRVALWVAVGILLGECVAVALLSPRFRIKRVRVEGTHSLPTERILAQLPIGREQNLFLAPLPQWRKNILRLPGVAQVSLERVLPSKLSVTITERTPWASVKTKDGLWHTIDESFTPFRTSKQPEPGLVPLIVGDIAAWEALPGVPLPSAGLETARECVHWVAADRNFSLLQIEINQDSGVSLRSKEGIEVKLGSGERIKAKLTSLEKLLAERSDLVRSNQIDYINLFAADAPAIGLRTPINKVPKTL
jgi:cell division protein FtsQ